jgi:spermidine/putrescine transport system permease protein
MDKTKRLIWKAGFYMKKKTNSSTLAKYIMIGPVSLWQYLLVAIPFMYIIGISFMNKGTYGGVEKGFTLKNYSDILNSLYISTFAKSLGMSFVVTIVCLVIAYPFSYFVSEKGPIEKKILMSMVMVPFCVSMIIRIFSWVNILRADGIINRLLIKVGIIQEPLKLVYNHTGAMIGLIYMLMPFMILPLYNSMEKFDRSLLEASSDLGARPYITFIKITLPMTKAGIFAGSVMVFIPSMGLYFITDLMGGSKTLVIGNLIKNQFITARNWPLGAAMSVILMIITFGMLKGYQAAGGNMEDLSGI